MEMNTNRDHNIGKSLILSSIESLWPKHGHAVLVDDFCNFTKDPASNSIIDLEISKDYGLDKNTNDENHKGITELFNLLLPQFINFLNAYHQVQESSIYWERIITHWLFRSISALLVNYRHLEQVLLNHQIEKVLVAKERFEDLIPNNSLDFALKIRDPAFIAVLRSEILRHILIENQGPQITEIQTRILSTESPPQAQSVRARIFAGWNYFFRKCDFRKYFDNYCFMGSTYLPRYQEAFLKMSFFQMPIFYESPLIKSGSNYASVRNSSFFVSKDSNREEMFIFSNIASLIPRSYLEDFHKYRSHILASNLPKCPSTIVTANNYDMDDYFKIWSSEKYKNGSKIIVWQHGNNIGTARHSHYPEVSNSDRYVTWGWSHTLNTQHGFCQNFGSTPKPRSHRQKNLLLIQDQFPTNWNLTDTANRFKYYVQDQHAFIKSLSAQPISSLIIRKFGFDLNNNFANKHWHDLEIQENMTLKFDNKHGSIYKLVRRSRIAVFAYYSTGFLECLAMDHPTIAFWREGFDIFSDEVVQDFIPLYSNGLIHFSADSASNHVNANWDDVYAWWTSPSVVNAKKTFVEKHSRQSRKPIREFRSIINGFNE
jgi:putative transferase (TIGR04331 family)